MGVLTDLASAKIKKGVKTLYGAVMTKPALLVTDGINATYGCDVNIGPHDPTGRINQYMSEKGKSTMLTNLPGSKEWHIGDELTINTVLHAVPIARGNDVLIYADIGNPVELRRNDSGTWEIVAFSRELPGTYTLVPVEIPELFMGTLQSDMTAQMPPIVVGDWENLSLTTHKLTLAELGTYGPFGTIPLGASAIFIGGSFVRLV